MYRKAEKGKDCQWEKLLERKIEKVYQVRTSFCKKEETTADKIKLAYVHLKI